MKVKTYRGQEVGSLMTRIREEIGEEAVILSMKEGENFVEVEVGIEQNHENEEGPIADLRAIPETVEALQPRKNLKSSIFPAEVKKTERVLQEILLRQGIDRRFASIIAKGAEIDKKIAHSADRYIANGLSQILTFNSIMPDNSRVVGLVGATGVGKTTTIAKLAARLRAAFEIKIALISVDSYRVGAGYHLQTYASLMNMPFRMIDGSVGTSTAEQLRRAVDSFADFDLVLVDTAGCGPREKGRITELQSDLELVPEMEKILVLPAPSNDRDLHQAGESFDAVGFSRVILSKIDESGFLGPVLNTVIQLDRPIAVLTTGQRVPEDIEPASARRIAWMLSRVMH